MATSNINRVVLTGNLTRDPLLRNTSSGTPVCGLRIASNTRRRTSSGEWVNKPNYLSVTAWGALGENCHRFLAKGRPVAIDGRLEWREWEAQDGTRRESVEIVADSVQFLGSAPDASGRLSVDQHHVEAGAGSARDTAGPERELRAQEGILLASAYATENAGPSRPATTAGRGIG